MMADAARYNVDRGAQIIDINMGCPAKKVCNVAAGSALLQQRAAGRCHPGRPWCGAVRVPVTLKIRTGWRRTQRNAVTLARIAEDAGVQALASTAARAPAAFVGARRVRHHRGGEGRGAAFR